MPVFPSLLLILLYLEEVVRWCSPKKVFLQIWQNSQRNTYAKESFLINYFFWKESFLQEVLKTFWRRLEDVLARGLKDVLKTSWWRLEDDLNTFLQDVMKTSWHDVLKMSSEDKDERRLQYIFKMSSSRRMFAGLGVQTFS